MSGKCVCVCLGGGGGRLPATYMRALHMQHICPLFPSQHARHTPDAPPSCCTEPRQSSTPHTHTHASTYLPTSLLLLLSAWPPPPRPPPLPLLGQAWRRAGGELLRPAGGGHQHGASQRASAPVPAGEVRGTVPRHGRRGACRHAPPPTHTNTHACFHPASLLPALPCHRSCLWTWTPAAYPKSTSSPYTRSASHSRRKSSSSSQPSSRCAGRGSGQADGRAGGRMSWVRVTTHQACWPPRTSCVIMVQHALRGCQALSSSVRLLPPPSWFTGAWLSSAVIVRLLPPPAFCHACPRQHTRTRTNTLGASFWHPLLVFAPSPPPS